MEHVHHARAGTCHVRYLMRRHHVFFQNPSAAQFIAAGSTDHWAHTVPSTTSQNRVMSLIWPQVSPCAYAPQTRVLHSLSGEETGLYFGDSSKLAVCHNRRIDRHRVFDGLAARGKTSMGWFFGLKLLLVINHKGQIMALKITPGNTADSTVLDEITRHLTGKLYADKGYISHEVFSKLWQRGLHLITGIRRNMRNHLMLLGDKILLRKRFVIETVFDILKCEMGLEHTRHRSPVNAMVHVLSCLVAYAYRPGKPAISLKTKQIKAYP